MPNLAPDGLERLAAAILQGAGCGSDEAEVVARNLVEANLKGHDSHGVTNLPTYIKHLKSGGMKPNRSPEVVRDEGPFLVVDGGRGLGQSVARQAVALAIGKAQTLGVAVLAIRNSGHMGRIGAYGEQCAEADLVSLHFVNAAGHVPYVAAPAAAEPRFGTNPFCFAVPAARRNPAVILDCATSKVAWGKLKVAFNKGEKVPEGLLRDPQGKPTTDPSVMVPDPLGAMVMFGGHKGYGIALMCELLGGALTGGATTHPAYPRDDVTINGMLSILIQPARLGDLGRRMSEVDAVIDYVRSAAALDPDVPVLIAGEPERIALAKRRAEGIPLDAQTWQDLCAAARSVGVEPEG